jgi:hypothetical protein
MTQPSIDVISARRAWRRIAPLLAAAAASLLVLSGCASKPPHARRQASATTSTSSGGAVPTDFAPESLTAVGERDYWLLGRVPCNRTRCHAILHTTDGGKSFVSMAAPPLPENGSVPMLRFADRRDGFAYVLQVGGVLYATHDGGARWVRLTIGDVLQFTTAGRHAYAITARCSTVRCRHYRFQRTLVTGNRWAATALPFTADGSLFGLAARGPKVLLLGTRASKGAMAHDELGRSSNGGRTFITGPGPCYAGLGGELAPGSPRVIWAVCPTGLLAGAWRSIDGGVSFARLKTPALANSALVAPASERVAVLFGNGAGARLLRTTDGGGTWTAAKTPRAATDIQSVDFSSAKVGAVLVQVRGRQTNVFWRTTDGGAVWSQVPLR